MIKNENEVTDPQDDFLGGMSSEDNLFDENEDDYEYCEIYEAVMKAIFISRPLGILWDDDLIENFLVSKGFKMIERIDEDGEVFSVPVKPGAKIIPDRRDSLRRTFDREIQKTLLKWLLKVESEK